MHYNLQLMPHYCEDVKMDKPYKNWDDNIKNNNLKYESLVLEKLNVTLVDYDYCGEMPPHLLPLSP